MDIATLSAATIAAITPYLVKSGESIAEEAGKGLWSWLGKWFKSEGEEETLKKLAANPENAETTGEVKATLKGILKRDETLVSELTQLVEAAKVAQPNVTNNSINVSGNNNNVIQGVNGSNINIGNTTTNNHHSGSGDIVGGDKVINNSFYGGKSVDAEKGGVWKKMLTENKISEAIEYLLNEYKDDTDKSNTLLLFLGRHNLNQSNITKGIINHSDATMTQNQIVNAILSTFS